jgi:hypothetical protein
MLEIRAMKSARELPPEWDSACSDYFQTREFLLHCEAENPCGQEYLSCVSDSGFSGGAVLYSLAVNVFTYMKGKGTVKMRICGVPCSVSASGLLGDAAAREACLEKLASETRGLRLFLNMAERPTISGLAAGATFPAVVLEGLPSSWEGYLRSLRAPYRRWLKLIEKASSPLLRKEGPCSEFTSAHHRLYLEVLGKSEGPLETLSEEFFRRLPPAFRLESLYSEDALAGWSITLRWKDTFYFFLTGLDYGTLKGFDTYFALLASIVKRGIESGARRIDLGQTTEWAKCRFGGILEPRYMAGHHSNPIANALLWIGKGLLAYRSRDPGFRVFKEKP